MRIFSKALLLSIIFVFSSYNLALVAESADAEKFMLSTSNRVVSLLDSHTSSEAKEQQLRSVFSEVMDIDWIGKFVLGKYWNTLSDTQKISYLQSYRKFLLSSYVPLFKDYNGQKFVIKNIKEAGKDQFIVVTEIQSTQSAAAYKVEYRLKANSGAFKVRDIIAEGISMLATQRADFSSIITNSGFDALIEKLHNK